MNQPLVRNAANEDQVDEAKEKLRHSGNREKADWIAIMSTDAGFRVLRSLLEFTRLESSPMGGADRDIFWRIGRQEVGRFIKERMILADRKKYFEMELKLGEGK